MRIIFLGFFIRILIGFYEVFYGPSPWASGDSHEFNRVAIEYSNGFTEFEFKIGYIYSFLSLKFDKEKTIQKRVPLKVPNIPLPGNKGTKNSDKIKIQFKLKLSPFIL